MELKQIWKILVRRWWLVAIPAVVAFAFAAYGYVTTPAGGGYSAGMRFTAATSPDEYRKLEGYEDGSYYPWLASEYVVNGMTDWVRTSTFAEEVSALLAKDGLEVASSTLEAIIVADNTRSVMDVSIGWHDPDELVDICFAVAEVLEGQVTEYFPQFGDEGVVVVLLDEPAPFPVAPSLSSRLEPIIRAVVGLAGGVLLAFIFEYLDPALHERDELEKLGLAVVAEIPREK